MSIYILPTIPALAAREKIQEQTGRFAVITGNRVELIQRHTPKKAASPAVTTWPTGGDAA